MSDNCLFCQKKIDDIDFQDVDLIKRFVSGQAKIISPRRTGLCTKHQRKIAKAVKRARHFGLLPVTNR